MRLSDTIKLPFSFVKQIFAGKTVPYTGELYSPEHKQSFKTGAIISIGKSKENKPLLAINGIYYAQWFREQKSRFLENLGIKVNETKKQQRRIQEASKDFAITLTFKKVTKILPLVKKNSTILNHLTIVV